MKPVPASIRRTRLLEASAMKTFPSGSTATPVGLLIRAETAAAPSPEYPATPVPATVVMAPVPASTRRTRALP
jgi:hypothetical protein